MASDEIRLGLKSGIFASFYESVKSRVPFSKTGSKATPSVYAGMDGSLFGLIDLD